MHDTQDRMTEKESLEVISSMIAKAKNSYYETGVGPILWGGVIAFCSIINLMQVRYGFTFPFDVWLLTVVAIVPTVVLSAREKRHRRFMSHDDRAINLIWTLFGIAIFITIHQSIQVSIQFGRLKDAIEALGAARPAVKFGDYSTGYMLMLYGLPTLFTGFIKSYKPMIFGGLFCWLAALATAYVPLQVDLILMAISAIVAWLIPGIMLHSRYRRGRALAHV